MDLIESLDGLENLQHVDRSFSLSECPNLNSITALSNLANIGEFLRIRETALVNLNGLQNTIVGGSISIRDNEELVSLEGLKVERTINGDFGIESNGILEELGSVNQIDSIYGDLKIVWNSSLSSCQSFCKLLTTGFIEGDVSISSNLDGCNSIEEIAEAECILCLQAATPAISSVPAVMITIVRFLSFIFDLLFELVGIE